MKRLTEKNNGGVNRIKNSGIEWRHVKGNQLQKVINKLAKHEDIEKEKEEEKEICRQAIETYGVENQTRMMFEEMGELQQAICKNLRGKPNIHNIAEEIADVEIMLGQMKLIFGVEEMSENWKEEKLERLAERLQE